MLIILLLGRKNLLESNSALISSKTIADAFGGVKSLLAPVSTPKENNHLVDKHAKALHGVIQKFRYSLFYLFLKNENNVFIEYKHLILISV